MSSDSRTELGKLPEMILQTMMDKKVSEQLGTIINQDTGQLTKGMNEADAKRSKLMLLAMAEESAERFFKKVKSRLNQGDSEQ